MPNILESGTLIEHKNGGGWAARARLQSGPTPGSSSQPRSPKAGCSSQMMDSGRDSPKPGSSRSTVDHGLGPGFQLRETASFLNGLPPDIFGLDDWGEDAMLSQVLAASQQEYLDSLKEKEKGGGEKEINEEMEINENKNSSETKEDETCEPGPSASSNQS